MNYWKAQAAYDNSFDREYELLEADARQAEEIEEFKQLGLFECIDDLPSDVDWDMPF